MSLYRRMPSYGKYRISSTKSSLFAIFSILVGLLFFSPHSISAQSGVDLVVHFVEGAPAERAIAYDVRVYLSAVDGSGSPLTSLTAEDLLVAEDSQPVQIDSLELAQAEPINLVLLMDTSGSMGGSPIGAARSAAANFVSNLGDQDRVAVLTFNDSVQNLVDFTTDKTGTKDKLSLMESTPDAGTCLYDALYQAAQLTASVPSGRRAVVVFTDGVDEARGGGACSVHTVEDILNLASGGNTRTPIYALGLGNRVNANDLERIASLTGGRELFSDKPDQLETMFQRLSDQLRSQYLLRYTSVAGPGAHTLAVSLDYSGARDNDTRNFLLPLFPPRVSFLNLTEGQEIGGSQKLIAEVSAQNDLIHRVSLLFNGEEIASDETRPYEFPVDFGAVQPGTAELTAIVYGVDNTELARTVVSVTVTSAQTQPSVGGHVEQSFVQILFRSLVGLLILAGGIAAILILSNRRHEHLAQAAPVGVTAGSGEVQAFDLKDELTDDDLEPSPDTLGVLTVTASEDPSMLGHRFDLIRSITSLGHSASNDIFFSRDRSVARLHARIEAKKDNLYLSRGEAVGSGGGSESENVETFVNDELVGPDPVRLQNGDEIRLGTRIRLKFQAVKRIGGSGSI